MVKFSFGQLLIVNQSINHLQSQSKVIMSGVEIPLVETQEKPKDPESGDESEELKATGDTVYPLREATFKIPFSKSEIMFNPPVALIGLVPLWGLAIFGMSNPDGAKAVMGDSYNKVVELFTWFYIGKL